MNVGRAKVMPLVLHEVSQVALISFYKIQLLKDLMTLCGGTQNVVDYEILYGLSDIPIFIR